MRLIDADALKADYGMKDDCADCEKELHGKVRSCEYDHIYSKMDFCGWIDDAPTIDAVEVVRCKDCAKREYCRTTNVWATVPDDDWFCADAERRSDEKY